MALFASLFTTHVLPEEKISSDTARPLSMALANEELELVEICAGRKLTHRLAELGLTPGVHLHVVQDNGGPLLLCVRGSRIAIGRGMAHKLMVIPVE